MEPHSIIILAVSASLLFLAFIYSLISRVLTIDSRDFNEIVLQGSFFSSIAAAMLFGLEFAGGHLHLWLAIFVGIYFFVFIIPEILATTHSDTLSKFCTLSYKVFKYIFLPSAKISIFFQNCVFKILGYDSRLSFLTESMRGAINNEESPSALEEEEKQMIRNIFVFADTPVRKIMTPRVEIHAIDVQTPLQEVIKLLNSERYSRLPVYSGSIDNIIGVLSNRVFLEWYTEKSHEQFALEQLVRPVVFVPTSKKIDALLHELKESSSHLAIVMDEYGGTAGLVTMEDILEEIVGEIKDEDDSEEDMGFVKQLPTGQYLLDPIITLSDLENRLNIHFSIDESDHIETLSGLIQHSIGSLPETGASIEIQGYTFKIKKMDGTKMEEVILETSLPNPS